MTRTSPTPTIRVIKADDLRNSDPEMQRAVAGMILRGFQSTGAVSIQERSLPTESLARSAAAWRRFLNQPTVAKRTTAQPAVQLGWVERPDGHQALVFAPDKRPADLADTFPTLYPTNVWPGDQMFQHQTDLVRTASEALCFLVMLCLGSRVQNGDLTRLTTHGPHRFQVVSVTPSGQEETCPLGSQDDSDWMTVLTLICLSDGPGTQLLEYHEQWYPVPLQPQSWLLLAGPYFRDLTGIEVRTGRIGLGLPTDSSSDHLLGFLSLRVRPDILPAHLRETGLRIQ